MKTVSHMSRKYAGPANHNSRSDFKVMSSNIDFTKTKNNWYWNCFTGDTDQKQNFKKVEEEYYTKNYTASLNAQNERHIKQRHPKRCKTMEQIINGKNTKPHEQILQFGNEDDHATREQLLDILKDYVKWYNERFPQAVILDMALHMDETTPHIHIRRVFEVETEDGKKVLQGQALREMGLERPNPKLPNGQYNNELMTFTAMNRDKLTEIAIAHGLTIEVTDEKCKTKHVQPVEYKLKEINEEIEEKTEMNKKLEQDIKHSNLELEQLNDRLNVLLKDIDKAESDKAELDTVESDFQIAHDRLQKTRDAIKEAERTKKTLTEENEELTEVLDTQRKSLNQAKEAIRTVENWLYGYDGDDLPKVVAALKRYRKYCENETGVTSLPQPESFLEREKKEAEYFDRMLRNIPVVNTPQTDDGYDY